MTADASCQLPACFLRLDNEADHYVFAYVLHPGVTSVTDVEISLLRRTIKKFRQDFDRLKIRVCIEGGYSTSEVLELLDEKKVERAVVQTGNLVVAIDMVRVAAAGL